MRSLSENFPSTLVLLLSGFVLFCFVARDGRRRLYGPALASLSAPYIRLTLPFIFLIHVSQFVGRKWCRNGVCLFHKLDQLKMELTLNKPSNPDISLAYCHISEANLPERNE